MSLSKQRFLVVGLGLAGTLISYLLKREGAAVRVINRSDEQSASRVAAGMWNPLSFRRAVPTWMADTMIAHIHQLYPDLETELAVRFFHPRKIIRYFPNEDYQNQWGLQAQKPEVARYLLEGEGKQLALKVLPEGVNEDANFYGVVGEAGYVDLPKMMDAWKQRLMDEGCYREGSYQEEDRQEGEQVIFANGVGALEHLPELDDILRKNKGEVLTLKTDWEGDTILNNGKWLLPLENGLCRLGASYDWRSSELVKSDEVKGFLLEKLSHLLPEKSHEIVKHEVGLRPTTKDRRPLVGALPNREGTYLFNGLGTRGVLIGPYCAQQLVEHLKTGAPLPEDIVASRFL